jgi:hypothetical protein
MNDSHSLTVFPGTSAARRSAPHQGEGCLMRKLAKADYSLKTNDAHRQANEVLF